MLRSEKVKEFQCQFTEQLKCLDVRANIDNSILGDLNEFYRKRAALEQDYAESLHKLTESFRQKLINEKQRRQHWPKYSSLDLINTLIVANQRTSLSHFVMAHIFGQQMTQRLLDVQEDVARLQKQSREVLQQCQHNIISSHLRLNKDYKAYVTSYTIAEEARKNYEKIKDRLDKKEKKHASKNNINAFQQSNKYKKLTDELIEKKEIFDSKFLANVQARNEYILQIAAANKAIEKFSSQEIHDVLECHSYGYHNNLSRAILNHINCEEALITSHRTIIDMLHSTMNDIDARKDTGVFLDSCANAFNRLPEYKFQFAKDDVVSQINVDRTNKDLVASLATDLNNTVQFSLVEVDEIWKTIEEAAKILNSLISQQDYEVADTFLSSKLRKTRDSIGGYSFNITTDGNLYMSIRNGSRTQRIEQEKFYIECLKKYLSKNFTFNVHLAKLEKLQNSVGDMYSLSGESPQDELEISFTGGIGGLSCSGSIGGSTSSRITRQPTKKVHRRLGVKELQSKPRLFGGSLEDYVERSGESIPLIITVCVRVINQYGMRHQGVFRIPGSQTEMVFFRELFEKGDKSLVIDRQFGTRDVNSIAGLLKLYFRELVEPVFPNCIFNRLIECIKQDTNEETLVTDVRKVIDDLSDTTFVVLRYLFGFLNHLCDFSTENKMDAQNLAICLGPCLLPLPSDLSKMQFEYQPYVNHVIRLLIERYSDIFEHTMFDNSSNSSSSQSDLVNNKLSVRPTEPRYERVNIPLLSSSSSRPNSTEDNDNISDFSLDTRSHSSSNILNDKDDIIEEDSSVEVKERDKLKEADDNQVHNTITRCESNKFPDKFKETLESILTKPHLTRKLSDSDMRSFKYAVTIADYKAGSSRELSFSKGQAVKLQRRLNPHWWEGCLNSGIPITSNISPLQIGLIPHSYLSFTEDDSIGSLKKFAKHKSVTKMNLSETKFDRSQPELVDISIDDNYNNEVPEFDADNEIIPKEVLVEDKNPEGKDDKFHSVPLLNDDQADDDFDFESILADMMEGFKSMEAKNTIKLKSKAQNRYREETLALEKKFISPLSKHTPDLVRDLVSLSREKISNGGDNVSNGGNGSGGRSNNESPSNRSVDNSYNSYNKHSHSGGGCDDDNDSCHGNFENVLDNSPEIVRTSINAMEKSESSNDLLEDSSSSVFEDNNKRDSTSAVPENSFMLPTVEQKSETNKLSTSADMFAMQGECTVKKKLSSMTEITDTTNLSPVAIGDNNKFCCYKTNTIDTDATDSVDPPITPLLPLLQSQPSIPDAAKCTNKVAPPVAPKPKLI